MRQMGRVRQGRGDGEAGSGVFVRSGVKRWGETHRNGQRSYEADVMTSFHR